MTFPQLEIHIGYVYGRPDPPAHASRFTPKFEAGARLPHAWIHLKDPTNLPAVDVSYVKEFSKKDVESRRYSTLDLCPFDSFTLIVGCRKTWSTRFETIQAFTKDHGVKLCLCVAGEDFEVLDQSHDDLFADRCGLSTGGGLLVRPDQHILEVLRADIQAEQVGEAVLKHLGY